MTGPHNQPLPIPLFPSHVFRSRGVVARLSTINTLESSAVALARGSEEEEERGERRGGRESERGEEREGEEEEEEERRTVFSSSTPRGARDADGGYGGKMCVPGYSGSSWESSFDSQCLEIIRGRGGPGVATATANQRAKKNFSFYIAHFSLLAPRKGARGRVRGVARSLRITAEGVAKPLRRHPPRKIMYAKTRWNAWIYPRVRVPNRARIRARIGERGRRETPTNLDCTLHPARSCLRATLRDLADATSMQQSRPGFQHSSCEFSPPTDTTSRLSSLSSLPVALLLSSIVVAAREKTGENSMPKIPRRRGSERLGGSDSLDTLPVSRWNEGQTNGKVTTRKCI